MTYTINWEYTKTLDHQKCFRVYCKLNEHKTIKSFSIHIEENKNRLEYSFSVRTIDVHDPNYNYAKTRSIQKEVLSPFLSCGLKMCYGASEKEFNLYSDATKELTIACTRVLFTLVALSEEDQSKILNFLETGIFTHQQVFDNILGLIFQNKIQSAVNQTFMSEQMGYSGIMFQIGEVLFSKGCIQPSYIVFSNVPSRDAHYKQAQIAAAKLATAPQVAFNSRAERLKAVFTHCQHAGQEGQMYIDTFFLGMTGLKDSKQYTISNVQTNFETLSNLAMIIAQQNEEILKLREQLAATAASESQYNTGFPLFSTGTSSETKKKDEPTSADAAAPIGEIEARNLLHHG